MKKTILLALAFIAGILTMNGAARHRDNNGDKSDGFNFLSALCVVFFVGIMTACGGGGGSGNTAMPMPMTTPTTEQVALVDRLVGEGVTREELFQILLENNISQREYFEQRLRELGLLTNIQIFPAVVNMPNLAAIHSRDDDGSYYFSIYKLHENNLNGYVPFGTNTTVRQTQVATWNAPNGLHLTRRTAVLVTTTVSTVPSFPNPLNPPSPPSAGGGNIINATVASHLRWIEVVENGTSVLLQPRQGQVFFNSDLRITLLEQLCPAPWLATYINENFPGTICSSITGASFSPDMSQVVVAAMADGFSPGLSFTDTPLTFFGRYDGDDRAAGFTYNFNTFALRIDYTRLPSKQDNNVWLDTYRLGVLQSINDEARFFAGVDNYKNAIFVLDTNGKNMHRLGVAVGNGYAVKYEYRLNL